MENNENSLSQITDTLESLVTGVPAPVRKNFFKAFAQLCTAAVDVPVAWLEGKANIIRATTDARNDIIKKSGIDISNNINISPEYAEKAGQIYASKIIKQQINLDKIVLRATEEINNNHSEYEKIGENEISEDWLNEFENYAKLKSSEDMQIIFSKILANEIHSPGKFKIKTLRTISQLTSEVAKIFLQFCSNCITVRKDGIIGLAFSPQFKKSAIYKEDFEYDDLFYFDIANLKEYDLVMTDNFSFNFKLLSTEKDYHTITFVGDKNIIITPQTEKARKLGLVMSGNYLSDSGMELLSILNNEINPKLLSNLTKYFNARDIDIKLI
ncbi:DUF2806 domain-containing protein [Chryseobacterium oranimense]|uniref:DUF2806 domain-containing protein n=1 Tax=Chryseobacterium oranimense TaxID=421058 RepID=UPI0031DDC1B9